MVLFGKPPVVLCGKTPMTPQGKNPMAPYYQTPISSFGGKSLGFPDRLNVTVIQLRTIWVSLHKSWDVNPHPPKTKNIYFIKNNIFLACLYTFFCDFWVFLCAF